MRRAAVLFREMEAGVITQHDDGSFLFRYHDTWLSDNTKPAVSLTLPKTQQEYRLPYLFPFFYNMLPEGANKQSVCRTMRIDENDSFGILMNTANNDSIGAVRVVKIQP